MSDATHSHAAHDHGDAQAHFSQRVYVIGFLLSVVLTTVPFWLVMTGKLAPGVTAAIIVACAITQIIVHTICFLHVNSKVEGGWTLLAYIFTAVLVLIVISGSLWIMYHLNENMMPAPSMQMSSPS